MKLYTGNGTQRHIFRRRVESRRVVMESETENVHLKSTWNKEKCYRAVAQIRAGGLHTRPKSPESSHAARNLKQEFIETSRTCLASITKKVWMGEVSLVMLWGMDDIFFRLEGENARCKTSICIWYWFMTDETVFSLSWYWRSACRISCENNSLPSPHNCFKCVRRSMDTLVEYSL